MSTMRSLRAYHACLAVLTVLSLASGDLGLVHSWLGYGVGLVILLRLSWALAGVRQLGLSRFYPVFKGLRLDTVFTHPAVSRTLLLGIAVCLIGVTLTGIALDKGRAIGLADGSTVAVALADDAGRDRRGGSEGEGPMGDFHEMLGNLLITIVVLHVAYLLLFKRPLAKFMLFLDTPRDG